jgi:Ala-tRNA(Pro) deacylase
VSTFEERACETQVEAFASAAAHARSTDTSRPVRALPTISERNRRKGDRMFVSQTVMGYLDRQGIDFDLLAHKHTHDSIGSARAAHVEPDKLAKGVLLCDDDQYVLAVVPADKHVNLFALRELLDTSGLTFATENDMEYIFRDCERGALPIVGPAFGLSTAVDDELLGKGDIYFEAGDHEHLVHLGNTQFQRMMAGQPHGCICG